MTCFDMQLPLPSHLKMLEGSSFLENVGVLGHERGQGSDEVHGRSKLLEIEDLDLMNVDQCFPLR